MAEIDYVRAPIAVVIKQFFSIIFIISQLIFLVVRCFEFLNFYYLIYYSTVFIFYALTYKMLTQSFVLS